jgi:hypothetical protein
MRLGEVSLSLPSIVDRHGIARVLPVALNSSEWRALEASAEVVRVLTAGVTKGRSISAYPAVGPEVTIAGREPGNGPRLACASCLAREVSASA